MSLRTVVPVLACTSTALMAGFYGTFSTLVMPALRRADATQGMHAMQLMNKAAPAPWLAVGLLLAGGTTLAATADALARREGVLPTVAGTSAYWLTVIVTIAYNVPHNDRLASLPAGHDYWATYLREWVPANHVRTAACLVATALLAAAVMSARDGDLG